MASVVWDTEGVIHFKFLPQCENYAQYYSGLLRNDVHQAIWKIRPRNLPKKIIHLHDNARQHMANLSKATLAAMSWESMTHPP
jgi:hypothetical protein